MPTTLFSTATQPGYAGYFGPTSGARALIGFGKNAAAAAAAANNLSNNWGFLTETYQLDFGRPVQIKHFLNTTLPAAQAGYAQGTLLVQGMVGTYAAFQNILGAGSGNLCDPLVCVIKNGSSFQACTGQGNSQSGTEIQAEGLIAATFRITGSVQQDGTLYQQATVQFTVTGVTIK